MNTIGFVEPEFRDLVTDFANQSIIRSIRRGQVRNYGSLQKLFIRGVASTFDNRSDAGDNGEADQKYLYASSGVPQKRTDHRDDERNGGKQNIHEHLSDPQTHRAVGPAESIARICARSHYATCARDFDT